MFMDLMKKDDDKGNNMLRALIQMDDEMAQEAVNHMKRAFAENSKKFGVQKISFEAVEQWIRESRNAAKAQQEKANKEQEKAMQEAERREDEVKKFKEEQKQIMIEKERQTSENERKKKEQGAMMNNERVRSAAQAHDEREPEMQRKSSMKEMRIKFGRYYGRRCESIYQEDHGYCRWVQDVETESLAVIEFKNFLKVRNEQWKEECREVKRIELERERGKDQRESTNG